MPDHPVDAARKARVHAGEPHRPGTMTDQSETMVTCPTCGHPVRVVGSDEGTQHYEVVEDTVLLSEWLHVPVPTLAGRLICNGCDETVTDDSWPCDAERMRLRAEEAEARLAKFAEDVILQFGYWSYGVGGFTAGGLSTLKEAFAIRGWDDPHVSSRPRRGSRPRIAERGTQTARRPAVNRVDMTPTTRLRGGT